ncbi:Protein of unknown function [Colwellia chukchiensis]|uniref:SMODS and SLOG-associating 2TM effector domain-containing protein n=1 Tax=Colwellia chukchiensis TaxID=641665 RepID=A0A1H7SW63_9GAMM|nr:DUF4231 domain-containing protein [Colwellia chukchiensis]SEL76890.1 Protein of unknown function [Colwellia chukchiensis]
MDENEYLSKRIDAQIQWYDRKSQHAQRIFKALRGFEIVAAASIPLLTATAEPLDNTVTLFVVGIIGVLIVITSAITSLNQYQENWIEYRTTCETLKHEKYLFATKTSPYHGQDAFPKFVQRAEGLISKENSNWSQYTQANSQEVTPAKQ